MVKIEKEEIKDIVNKAYDKFNRGDKEHGQSLDEVKVVDELKEELLDIVGYVIMLWKKIEGFKEVEHDYKRECRK